MTYKFERAVVAGDSSYVFISISEIDDNNVGVYFKPDDNFSPAEVEELTRVATLNIGSGLTGMITATCEYEICNFAFYFNCINVMMKKRGESNDCSILS